MARQSALPGLEEREIKPLQEAAIRYAEIRDERHLLTTQEVRLKGELLQLMKKFKKESYEYDRVKVEIVVEEETVKVRVAKKKEDEEPDIEAASAIVEEMREPEVVVSRQDPLGEDINVRNQMSRRKRAARVH